MFNAAIGLEKEEAPTPNLTQGHPDSKRKLGRIIGGALGGFMLVVLLSSVALLIHARHRRKAIVDRYANERTTRQGSLPASDTLLGSLEPFPQTFPLVGEPLPLSNWFRHQFFLPRPPQSCQDSKRNNDDYDRNHRFSYRSAW